MGYCRLFPDRSCVVRGIAVPSGVAEQPLSDEETRRGAENRAAAAQARFPDADYWLGIEGGIEDQGGSMCAFAWISVRGPGSYNVASRSAAFALPPRIAELVRAGDELGVADDKVFGDQDSKRKGGAVGLLTGGAIDRAELYTHAVCLALIPFKNPTLYQETSLDPRAEQG